MTKSAFTVDDLLAYLDDRALPLDTPLMVNGAACTGIGRNALGVTVMNHRARALGQGAPPPSSPAGRAVSAIRRQLEDQPDATYPRPHTSRKQWEALLRWIEKR